MNDPNASLASLHLFPSFPPTPNYNGPVTAKYLFDRAIEIASPQFKLYSLDQLVQEWGLCQKILPSSLIFVSSFNESSINWNEALTQYFSSFILLKEAIQKCDIAPLFQSNPPFEKLAMDSTLDLLFITLPQLISLFLSCQPDIIAQNESLIPKLKETTRIALQLLRLLLLLLQFPTSTSSSSNFNSIYTSDRLRTLLAPWNSLSQTISDPYLPASYLHSISHCYIRFLKTLPTTCTLFLLDVFQDILQYLKPVVHYLFAWEALSSFIILSEDPHCIRNQAVLFCTALIDSPHFSLLTLFKSLPLPILLEDASTALLMLATCAHLPWDFACKFLHWILSSTSVSVISIPEELDLNLRLKLYLLQSQLGQLSNVSDFQFILTHLHESDVPSVQQCEALIQAMVNLGYATWEHQLLVCYLQTTYHSTAMLCLIMLRKIIECAPSLVRLSLIQRLKELPSFIKEKNECKWEALMFIVLG